MMMASLSNTAKVILGGSMDCEELLLLPGKWEGCKLWGVYTDIFKKDTVDEAARYCGSGTDKRGVAIRMDNYPAVHNGTRQADPGAHCDSLKRKDEPPNPRLIAVFDPPATPKPYVFPTEQPTSILLPTLTIGTTPSVHASFDNRHDPERYTAGTTASLMQGRFQNPHVFDHRKDLFPPPYGKPIEELSRREGRKRVDATRSVGGWECARSEGAEERRWSTGAGAESAVVAPDGSVRRSARPTNEHGSLVRWAKGQRNAVDHATQLLAMGFKS